MPAARIRIAVLAALLAAAALGPAGTARGDQPKPDRPAAAVCAEADATPEKTSFTEDHHGSFRVAGTWKASGKAVGVQLEYRIDSDRYGAESQRGAEGRWTYVDAFPECGPHTTRIHAYPLVLVGGREVICLGRDRSVAANFESSCLPEAQITGCAWRCNPGPPAVCTGTCTGQASGDLGGYVPYWGLDDAGYQAGPENDRQGPWTQSITCTPGQKVSFKVRGRAGTGGYSPPVEVPCSEAK